VSDAAAVLFLAIGVGIPLLFCLLAGSKDPVRRARVRWQIMLFGASLALIAFVFDLVQAQVLWACVFGFAAIAFAAGAVVEMRLRTGLRGREVSVRRRWRRWEFGRPAGTADWRLETRSPPALSRFR
jgi:multisubunit Na+/H+ antiporter MnhC subunit